LFKCEWTSKAISLMSKFLDDAYFIDKFFNSKYVWIFLISMWFADRYFIGNQSGLACSSFHCWLMLPSVQLIILMVILSVKLALASIMLHLKSSLLIFCSYAVLLLKCSSLFHIFHIILPKIHPRLIIKSNI
jgi:hypothetical protein